MADTLTLKASQSTAIEIPFSGYPQPDVTWTFNDKKLPDPKRIKTETIIGMSALTMAKVLRNDTGSYKITVTNEHGECSFTIRVIVLGKNAVRDLQLHFPLLLKSMESYGLDDFQKNLLLILPDITGLQFVPLGCITGIVYR